jgi:hypothetical protein
MNKKITTYEDLEEEKLRLLSLMKTQEAVIRTDLAIVRQNLQPLNKAWETMNKFATRDNTAPVINFGLEMGVDLFIRRFVLARAGWFTKIIIPFLVKNYSSHIIGEEKRELIINKIKGLFKKIRPSAQPRPDPIVTTTQ